MRAKPAGSAKGSPSRGSCRRRRLRGLSRKQPSPSRLRRATSPERERLWQGRKVCSLTAGFFLPLTDEDETCPLCQGLSHSGELSSAARLRGFVPEAPLSPHLSYTQKTARADARAVLAKFLEKAGGAFSFLLTPAPGERRSAGQDTRRHRRGYRPGRRCPHPPAAAGA